MDLKLPDPFTVVGVDPGKGFPVRGAYVETFWTPILGPASIALVRRLAYLTEARQGPVRIDQTVLAAECGLRGKSGQPARVVVSARLRRLVRLNLARLDGDTLTMDLRWPMLGETMIEDLPATLAPYARPPQGKVSAQ